MMIKIKKKKKNWGHHTSIATSFELWPYHDKNWSFSRFRFVWQLKTLVLSGNSYSFHWSLWASNAIQYRPWPHHDQKVGFSDFLFVWHASTDNFHENSRTFFCHSHSWANITINKNPWPYEGRKRTWALGLYMSSKL